MKSLQITDATRRIGAPEGWNHETMGICHTLEVVDAGGFMISVWGMTASDREKVVAGAPILLFIAGTEKTQHPVVSVEVGAVVPGMIAGEGGLEEVGAPAERRAEPAERCAECGSCGMVLNCPNERCP